MLDKIISSIFPTPPPKLCGHHKDTFCYLSIKDRHPVTITQIIDRMYKLGLNNTEHSDDTKKIAGSLSRLKNRLQTDKELEPINDKNEDVDVWNSAIKQLEANTWFAAPWLTIECYMYRKIHEIFQDTATLTYPAYDLFREEKCQGLQNSLSNMSKIGTMLSEITSPDTKQITEFLKFSLWGNKTDLSLLTHFNLELSDVQHSNVDKNNDMILCNDLDKVVQYITSFSNGKVTIVLDNAGYELFGDLCLAEVLLRTPHVSQVKFHMKSMPWFVSDVTDSDMLYMISSLKSCDSVVLQKLGETWDTRLKDESFVKTDNSFWTTHHGFCEMKNIAPDLYSELGEDDVVFFKGDLNYRKLVNDRMWPYDTTFTAALEEFTPTKLCALRTIKSDSIVGCDKGRIEHILSENRDSLFCGTYALVSCNF